MSSLSTTHPAPAGSSWRHWLQRHALEPASYELHVDGAAWPDHRDAARPARDLPERVHLGRGGVRAASLRVHQPLRVLCTSGTLWLTRERDIHDHVLEAGDEHLAEPGDAIVLFGMPSASVLIATC